MYHIYSSSIFVFIATFSLCFLFISCASQTFESQSETDFLPYVHSPAGVLRIPSDRDDRMGGWRGGKSKPPKNPEGFKQNLKNPMANFRAIKISRKQRQLQNKFGFTGRTRELSRSKDCFKYPQKFPTKPSYPKKNLPKFPYPKKILKSRI